MRSVIGLKEGWSSFILLNLMLLSVAWSIQAATWAESLSLLTWVVVVSLVIGLLLAKVPFPSLLAHALSLVLGIVWSAFLASTPLPPELTWTEKLHELLHRSVAWAEEVWAGGASTDNLVFVLGLFICFWLLSHLCAWFTFRQHRVWRVVIPNGAIMLLNLYYASPQPTGYFIAFLACSLLLLVRSNAYLQEREWRKAKISYDPKVTLSLVRDGAILSAIVLLLGWGASQRLTARGKYQVGGLLDRFEEPWGRVQSQWNRLFSALNYYEQPAPTLFREILLPPDLVELESTPIMEVKAQEKLYWRSTFYDQYLGSGWSNTDWLTLRLEGKDSCLQEEAARYALRRVITQSLHLLQPQRGLLYAAPQPLWVDVPAIGQVNRLPDPIGEKRPPNESIPPVVLSALFAESPSTASYTAFSSISCADGESLRKDRDEYLPWVRDRYLTLPESLPERVRSLSQRVVRGQRNAYDKARAIEAYLRSIPYNRNLEAPEGRDIVDYFLFEARQGYCYYYASAMVVMARSVGVPARMAVGYTSGEYDSERDLYLVRESDAHSWVEVYFPRYGWVEFEPTASEPLIRRPETEEGGEEGVASGIEEGEVKALPRKLPGEGPSPEGKKRLAPLLRRPYLVAGWGLVAASVLGLLSAAGVRIFRLSRVEGASVTERAYEMMARYARLVGVKRQAHLTPFEYARLIARSVPKGAALVFHITDSYVRERFGAKTISAREGKELERLLAVLRTRIWRQWLRNVLDHLVRAYRRLIE